MARFGVVVLRPYRSALFNHFFSLLVVFSLKRSFVILRYVIEYYRPRSICTDYFFTFLSRT